MTYKKSIKSKREKKQNYDVKMHYASYVLKCKWAAADTYLDISSLKYNAQSLVMSIHYSYGKCVKMSKI